ncbi:hypothetical protein GDO81_022241 [Engystomops pustulosus]|uniref:Uncharacterized protein n=1 Tax=Engystomops pustulosus TaxID=76066 RepID=A0AAV6YUM4_ENGPU|nr:hypothetical protein GDO81_022241 [Engystomops pustulosus]
MDLFGKLFNTVSAVSNLFTNPYRVRELALVDYVGCHRIKEDGRILLYKSKTAKSWDCLLVNPVTPQNAFRLVCNFLPHSSTCVFGLPAHKC